MTSVSWLPSALRCPPIPVPSIVLVVIALAASPFARAAEPAWSASAANRCLARTVLSGPLGARLPLDDKVKLLADVAKTILEPLAFAASPAEDPDLLGLRAAARFLPTDPTRDPAYRRAPGGFAAAASLELAAAAPRGTVPDVAFAALAEAATQADQPDLAVRAVEQIVDRFQRTYVGESVARALAARGHAAAAEALFAKLVAWDSPPVIGRVVNLLALGKPEDALAVAQAEDLAQFRARDTREVAWFHLGVGDAGAARRVLGLLRDALQQIDGGFEPVGLGELAAGYALLGDAAALDETRALAARFDPAAMQVPQLKATLELAARAEARGNTAVARRATELAHELLAALARAGGVPPDLVESDAMRAVVERVGVHDGAAAATRWVELLGPRYVPSLIAILARHDDVAGAVRLAPEPGFERLVAIHVAAAGRLERGDEAGARALIATLDEPERADVVRMLAAPSGRTGKLEPMLALLGASDPSSQAFDIQRAWAAAALEAGHVDAALAMIARIQPPELGAIVIAEMLTLDDRQIAPTVKERLFAVQLDGAGQGPAAARAAILIARAVHRAAQGERAGASRDLADATAAIAEIAEDDAKLAQLIALAGVQVQLGEPAAATLGAARALAATVSRSDVVDGYMIPADVGDEAVEIARLLRLARLQARAGDIDGARVEIAMMRDLYDLSPVPAERMFLGAALLQALTVAGPLDRALAFQFEATGFESPLAPIDALLRQAFKDADAVGVDAALAYLAERLAQMSEHEVTRVAAEALLAMAALERTGSAFDAVCPLPPDKSLVELATGGAASAAADALRACVGTPTPACVVALALPPANAQDRDERVWALGEALTRLAARGGAPIAADALAVLGEGLDARGRAVPRAASAAPRFSAVPAELQAVLGDMNRQLGAPALGTDGDHDEARYQLVRVLSAIDQPARALEIVPSIVNPVVRVQAVMRAAAALHRAGEPEQARDLLWLAREMNGSTPNALWGQLAIAYAEIGDMTAAVRMAQQSARQEMGRFDPRQLVDPVIGIVAARVRAGDAARALDRLALVTEAGGWRDLAAARTGIRLAELGKDDEAVAAARRVGDANLRRQSFAGIAAAQLLGRRPAAAAKAAADAGDAALAARAKALELAQQGAAQRRPVPAELAKLGDPAVRAEAFAVLAGALVAAKRPAEARDAADKAAAAARDAPASPIVAVALATAARPLATIDPDAARRLLADALVRTGALQATDATGFWDARVEPTVALLGAADALARTK